jgi:hypothetical protein
MMTSTHHQEGPLSHSLRTISRTRVEYALLAAAIGLALPLSACEFGIDGNGHRTDEVRETREFTSVESDGELDVFIERGDAFSVVVSIDSNLQHLVDVHVSGDTLVVDSERNFGHFVDGPHVWVTLPRLQGVSLDGSGRMVAVGFASDDVVDIDLGGSGLVEFHGEAAAIHVSHDGSGRVYLEGETDSIDLRLDGSGSIDARSCPALDGAFDLGGSGQILATVLETARASLSGSGRIDLYGGAVIERQSVSGSGSIRMH